MEIFKLKRPVIFEEREFEQFDLSGLEDLTGEEYATLLKEAERIDGADMVPEKSLTFAFLAAAKVTGQPFDLFKKMGAKDAARLRYKIGSFFSCGGLSNISASLLRKSAISLSIVLHADFFRLWRDMRLFDFLELMVDTEEVLEQIGKK